jgi:hypothetical protein
MTSNTAHAAQAVIVRQGNVERLELPGATFGLLADSGTARATLRANRLSLGTGADGATPHDHSSTASPGPRHALRSKNNPPARPPSGDDDTTVDPYRP